MVLRSMVLSPLGWHPSVAGCGGHIAPSTGCPSECGIPTGIARTPCWTLAQHETGDSLCMVSTQGTAGTVWGLPLAPPARPWPPSCAGQGEPGEGGAGRTVYVCRCQVLAGHRASRAGAQLLNPLRPPHTPLARDRARPTPLGWSLCTPVTPLPNAPHDQQDLGITASLAPVGPGGQEKLLPRGAPLGPCAATAPKTQLLPNWGGVSIPNV